MATFDHPFDRAEARAAVTSAFHGPSFAPPTDLERNGHLPSLTGAHARRLDKLSVLTDVEAEEMPPVKGLVGDLLAEESLAFLYGRSGRWKSFVALSWALCIATDRAWFGREVLPGTVIYITAEGARAFGKRITAWKRHNGFDGQSNLRIVPMAVHLLQAEHVVGFVEAVREAVVGAEPVKLIVVDTLARSMAGGDENSTKDASDLIDAADGLRQEFHATVLFVHHTGYDPTHMRGNSSFFGAADTVIRLVAEDDSKARLECGEVVRLESEKPKDTDPFETVRLTTEPVEWVNAATGEACSSLAIVEAGTPARTHSVAFADTSPPKGAFSVAHIKAWQLLVKKCADAPGGLTYDDWKGVCMKNGHIAESTFKVARSRLTETGWVRQADKRYRATTPTEGGAHAPIFLE